MKNIRISGKMKKVFVLRENEGNLVYIPLDSIQRVDYDRLLDIESRGGDMLNEMRKTKLDNGMNALAVYDDIIQVMHYADQKQPAGVRIPKPDEGRTAQERYEAEKEKIEKTSESSESPAKEQEQKEEPKKRRGPGRPPKSEKKDEDTSE